MIRVEKEYKISVGTVKSQEIAHKATNELRKKGIAATYQEIGYEVHYDILDRIDKNYIKKVIRPFWDRVMWIKKSVQTTDIPVVYAARDKDELGPIMDGNVSVRLMNLVICVKIDPDVKRYFPLGQKDETTHWIWLPQFTKRDDGSEMFEMLEDNKCYTLEDLELDIEIRNEIELENKIREERKAKKNKKKEDKSE